MILKKIVLDNFKSFRDHTEIDLDVPRDTPDKRVVLIGGMNGGGKTTILEAINICLYGARNEEVLERINRSRLKAGEANVHLELVFETDDGHEITICRSWRTNVVSGVEARDLKEDVSVSEDGERKLLFNLNDYIDLTIPRGVSQFFFFDGEKIQYMASDVDAEGKLKSAIESVLGIEIVRRIHDDLKFIYSEDKRASQGTSNQDVRIKQAELDKCSERHRALQEDFREANEELLELEQRRKQKELEFNRYFGFPPELSERKSELERQRARTQTEIENLSKDIKAFCADKLPLGIMSNLIPSLQTQLSSEKILKKQESLREASGQLAAQLVKDLFDPRCAACDLDVPPIKFSAIKSRVLASVTKILSAGTTEGDRKVYLGLSESQEAQLSAIVETVQRETIKSLRPIIDRREALERQLTELNRKLRELSVPVEEKAAFDDLRQELQSLDQNVGRKRQEMRGFEVEISKVESQKSLLEKEFQELMVRVEDERDQDAYLRLCQHTIKAVDEYIEELRKTKMSDLKSHIFQMFKQLATQADLIREIRIDAESYQISLVDKAGHLIPKENLSAGQKEIFAISLLWGLAQSTEYDLPVVIDTPLSRLDSQHRENIVSKYFPQAGVQVIILSTDTEVDKTYFARLQPCVAKSYQLVFRKAEEVTLVEPGYFWKE